MSFVERGSVCPRGFAFNLKEHGIPRKSWIILSLLNKGSIAGCHAN
jgi:hypothetical protein